MRNCEFYEANLTYLSGAKWIKEGGYVVRTFLFLYLVYLFIVKKAIKRDLDSFESKNLKDKLVRNRK